MNSELKKLLADYDEHLAYKKGPGLVKQRIYFEKDSRLHLARHRASFWYHLSLAAATGATLLVVVYQAYVADVFNSAEPLAAEEVRMNNLANSWMYRHYDEYLPTPVATIFFDQTEARVFMYYGQDEGDNKCLFFMLDNVDNLVTSVTADTVELTDFSTHEGLTEFTINADVAVTLSLAAVQNAVTLDQQSFVFNMPLYQQYL